MSGSTLRNGSMASKSLAACNSCLAESAYSIYHTLCCCEVLPYGAEKGAPLFSIQWCRDLPQSFSQQEWHIFPPCGSAHCICFHLKIKSLFSTVLHKTFLTKGHNEQFRFGLYSCYPQLLPPPPPLLVAMDTGVGGCQCLQQ